MIKIGNKELRKEIITINNKHYQLNREVINGQVVYESKPKLITPTIALEGGES